MRAGPPWWRRTLPAACRRTPAPCWAVRFGRIALSPSHCPRSVRQWGEGAALSGNVEVRDIGIPADLVQGLVCRAQTVERDFARAALPPRRADGHKGTFGKVLIVGGAVGYTGAPYLTAAAAVRTGCGLVSLGVPETIWPVEAAKCVSAMPFPLPDKHGRLSPKAKEEILERAAGCDAVALGPGLGRGDGVTELVLDLLQKIQQPMVLDADGINALGGAYRCTGRPARPDHGADAPRRGVHPHRRRPHRQQPAGAARAFGAAHGCVLGAEGPPDPHRRPGGERAGEHHRKFRPGQGRQRRRADGDCRRPAGPGATAVRAAAVGVWLHGRAGDLAAERLTPYGMTPEDVVSSTAGGHRGDPIKDGGFCGAQMGLRTNDDPVPAADGLRRHRRRGGGCGGCPDALSEHGGLRHGGGRSPTQDGAGLGGHAPVRPTCRRGETTVEVLAPETIAGVKAVLSDGEVELVYEDQCLNAGNLSSQEVSPMACLPQLMSACGRWLLEESEEDWQETSCLKSDGGPDRRAEWADPSTPLAAWEDGTPLRGRSPWMGEIILTADFTSFSFMIQ